MRRRDSDAGFECGPNIRGCARVGAIRKGGYQMRHPPIPACGASGSVAPMPTEYIHNLNEPLTCIVFVPIIFLAINATPLSGLVAENLCMICRCAGNAETTGTCISSARVAFGAECGGLQRAERTVSAQLTRLSEGGLVGIGGLRVRGTRPLRRTIGEKAASTLGRRANQFLDRSELGVLHWFKFSPVRESELGRDPTGPLRLHRVVYYFYVRSTSI